MNKKRDNDIKRMYKNRYTMQYIGDKYGISKQRVWRIINKDRNKK